MSLYLVRTKSKRDLVGIFFAEAIPRLVIEVSHVANTEDCEWLELPAGGIVWRPGRATVPVENEQDLHLDRGEITESWRKIFFARDVEWYSLLTPADVAS